MTNLILKVLIIFTLFLSPQEKLQYANGKPRSSGIDNYIKTNENQFIKEFKLLVKDSIYNDIFFATKNFKKTTDPQLYDPHVLAYNESSGNYSSEIVVNNEEKFSGFEYKNNRHKNNYNQNDYFVKPTVFHEICHYYFNQCILELQMIDTINAVNSFYANSIFIFPNAEMQFGAKFIEEGVCEYLIQSTGEVPEIKQYYIPKYENDLKDKINRYDILYGYSSQYLKDFMDYNILKFGKIKYPIFILLTNRPPTYKEILEPQLYFNRL